MSEVARPLGFFVMIEMEEVKELSKGGVYVGDVRREQEGCDVGYVRAVGNIAFRGLPGCNPSDYPPSHEFYKMEPHQIWGINIGDKVEYRRYEGKRSAAKESANMRYIPDTQIIGKITGEKSYA